MPREAIVRERRFGDKGPVKTNPQFWPVATGVVGSVIMLMGLWPPFSSAPLTGALNGFSGGMAGFFVLILSICGLLCFLTSSFKGAAAIGGATTLLVVYAADRTGFGRSGSADSDFFVCGLGALLIIAAAIWATRT